MAILGNSVDGVLNYVTDYTDFSGNPDLQSGNYLALKFEHSEGATTTVEILGGYSGPVTLDSDMNWVGRIESNEQQIKIVTTLGEESITRLLNLTNLVLDEPAI